MRVLNKYRLELHWEKVNFLADDEVEFIGAYFCGPVLKNAEKIQAALQQGPTKEYDQVVPL